MNKKTAIDALLDNLDWKEVEQSSSDNNESTLPYTTHEGILNLDHMMPGNGQMSLRVSRLNTGERVIDLNDLELFFEKIKGSYATKIL